MTPAVLAALLAVPSFAAEIPAGPVAVWTDMAGSYTLLMGSPGRCHESLEVEREAFLGGSDRSLGFYGLPRGSGKVLAQVQDIGMGLVRERESRPYPTHVEYRYRLREASFADGKLSYRVGELARMFPLLDRGELTEIELKGGVLTVRQGAFSAPGGPLSSVALSCAYRRAAAP